MKNKLILVLVGAILLFVVLGCGSLNPLSEKKPVANTPGANKTLTDKAVDTTVGDEKIGIPECDEVMDMLTAEANNPDDNFIVKAGKALLFNKIKQSIKDSIDQNKDTDKTEIIKTCKDAKAQLIKSKAEQDSKGK